MVILYPVFASNRAFFAAGGEGEGGGGYEQCLVVLPNSEIPTSFFVSGLIFFFFYTFSSSVTFPASELQMEIKKFNSKTQLKHVVPKVENTLPTKEGEFSIFFYFFSLFIVLSFYLSHYSASSQPRS